MQTKMTNPEGVEGPESSAMRVALWRALHVEVDPPPHLIEDKIGLELAEPEPGWRGRPDMDPEATKIFRASIVARARFVEDLVAEQAAAGLCQYVILGAGLDTFAQRRPDLASQLNVFEVDRPGPQAWKRQRLLDLSYGIPDWLHFVPVEFETDGSWWDQMAMAGFNADDPAVVACCGVSMYLTREATARILRLVAGLASGSTLALTFIPPLQLAPEEDRPGREASEKGARESGTPFIGFFTPAGMLALAREAGFKSAQHMSGSELSERYFTRRRDGLRGAEEFLIARV